MPKHYLGIDVGCDACLNLRANPGAADYTRVI